MHILMRIIQFCIQSLGKISDTIRICLTFYQWYIMQYQTEYLHKKIVVVCLCNRAVKSLLQISNASGQNFPNFSYLLLHCIELQNHCSLVFSSPLRMQRQAYAIPPAS